MDSERSVPLLPGAGYAKIRMIEFRQRNSQIAGWVGKKYFYALWLPPLRNMSRGPGKPMLVMIGSGASGDQMAHPLARKRVKIGANARAVGCLVAVCLLLGMMASALPAKEPYLPKTADPMTELWQWRKFSELDGKGPQSMVEAKDGVFWF